MQSDLTSKRVTIVGLGRSGLATARLLANRRAYITVTDEQPAAALKRQREELPAGVRQRLGGFHAQDFLQAELIIVSPGVPYDLPYLQQARDAGIQTLSELELASTQTETPLIAITGTNGKTTVSGWVGHLLEAAGHRARVCGNIGYAFCDAVMQQDGAEFYVVEVSSFQLEAIESFRPRVGVILNVTPDHLDRHGSFARYHHLKLQLAMNQERSDALIINHDDPQLANAMPPGRANRYATSRRSHVEQGAFLRHGEIVLRLEGHERVLGPRSLLAFSGVHHEENLLAAVLTAALAGVPDEVIAGGIPSLVTPPHRLEYVCEVRGARVYNDSKATNIGAVQKALESFPRGVILLLGGQNTGIDFRPLAETVRRKVAQLVLFGAAREDLAEALAGAVETAVVATLADAVEAALRNARPGRVILFSPGCTSFDEFADYVERGERFKMLIVAGEESS